MEVELSIREDINDVRH